MATRNQYRIEVVQNRLGIVWLRMKPPRGGEVIMAGEIRSDYSGALRTANNIARSTGMRVVEIFEGPRTFEGEEAPQ